MGGVLLVYQKLSKDTGGAALTIMNIIIAPDTLIIQEM